MEAIANAMPTPAAANATVVPFARKA